MLPEDNTSKVSEWLKRVFPGLFAGTNGVVPWTMLKTPDLPCSECTMITHECRRCTLVDDILYRALAKYIYGSRNKPGLHDEIKGLEHLDKVITNTIS